MPATQADADEHPHEREPADQAQTKRDERSADVALECQPGTEETDPMEGGVERGVVGEAVYFDEAELLEDTDRGDVAGATPASEAVDAGLAHITPPGHQEAMAQMLSCNRRPEQLASAGGASGIGCSRAPRGFGAGHPP